MTKSEAELQLHVMWLRCCIGELLHHWRIMGDMDSNYGLESCNRMKEIAVELRAAVQPGWSAQLANAASMVETAEMLGLWPHQRPIGEIILYYALGRIDSWIEGVESFGLPGGPPF